MSLLTSFARATLLYIPTGYPLLSGLVHDPVTDALMAREAGFSDPCPGRHLEACANAQDVQASLQRVA